MAPADCEERHKEARIRFLQTVKPHPHNLRMRFPKLQELSSMASSPSSKGSDAVTGQQKRTMSLRIRPNTPIYIIIARGRLCRAFYAKLQATAPKEHASAPGAYRCCYAPHPKILCAASEKAMRSIRKHCAPHPKRLYSASANTMRSTCVHRERHQHTPCASLQMPSSTAVKFPDLSQQCLYNILSSRKIWTKIFLSKYQHPQ